MNAHALPLRGDESTFRLRRIAAVLILFLLLVLLLVLLLLLVLFLFLGGIPVLELCEILLQDLLLLFGGEWAESALRGSFYLLGRNP